MHLSCSYHFHSTTNGGTLIGFGYQMRDQHHPTLHVYLQHLRAMRKGHKRNLLNSNSFDAHLYLFKTKGTQVIPRSGAPKPHHSNISIHKHLSVCDERQRNRPSFT